MSTKYNTMTVAAWQWQWQAVALEMQQNTAKNRVTMVIKADNPASSDKAITRVLQEHYHKEDEAVARASSTRDATALPLPLSSSDDMSAIAAWLLMNEELRATKVFETTFTYYGKGNIVNRSSSNADKHRGWIRRQATWPLRQALHGRTRLSWRSEPHRRKR